MASKAMNAESRAGQVPGGRSRRTVGGAAGQATDRNSSHSAVPVLAAPSKTQTSI